jgi:hypothetical protein
MCLDLASSKTLIATTVGSNCQHDRHARQRNNPGEADFWRMNTFCTIIISLYVAGFTNVFFCMRTHYFVAFVDREMGSFVLF